MNNQYIVLIAFFYYLRGALGNATASPLIGANETTAKKPDDDKNLQPVPTIGYQTTERTLPSMDGRPAETSNEDEDVLKLASFGGGDERPHRAEQQQPPLHGDAGGEHEHGELELIPRGGGDDDGDQAAQPSVRTTSAANLVMEEKKPAEGSAKMVPRLSTAKAATASEDPAALRMPMAMSDTPSVETTAPSKAPETGDKQQMEQQNHDPLGDPLPVPLKQSLHVEDTPSSISEKEMSLALENKPSVANPENGDNLMEKKNGATTEKENKSSVTNPEITTSENNTPLSLSSDERHRLSSQLDSVLLPPPSAKEAPPSTGSSSGPVDELLSLEHYEHAANATAAKEEDADEDNSTAVSRLVHSLQSFPVGGLLEEEQEKQQESPEKKLVPDTTTESPSASETMSTTPDAADLPVSRQAPRPSGMLSIDVEDVLKASSAAPNASGDPVAKEAEAEPASRVVIAPLELRKGSVVSALEALIKISLIKSINKYKLKLIKKQKINLFNNY